MAMDLTLTPRVKVIALAGILAAVVMIGGMQVLAHRQASAASAPLPPVVAIAYAEAQAGAKTAGAGFLPVNVLDEKIVAPITALVPGGGLLPDPGVLVFQRPGTLVTQFAGFADRDMVAQAAVNAIPAK